MLLEDPRTNPVLAQLTNACQDKCIFVYKTTKDITMLLLDDNYNIWKMLEMSKGTEVERLIRNYWTITSDPVPTGKYNPMERYAITKKRNSMREYDLPLIEWICKYIITPEDYSGAGATLQPDIYGTVFHLELIFCNATKWLKRDLDNVNDFQHIPKEKINLTPPTVQIYLQQLSLYESTNVYFHAGNLLEHSIWSLLFAEQYIKVFSIPNDTIKKLYAFTAFIHDIGKMKYVEMTKNLKTKKLLYNSVKYHPVYGYEYLMDLVPYYIVDNNLKETSKLDINKLLIDFGVNNNIYYRKCIALIILNHWDFGGEYLKYYNISNRFLLAKKYIRKVIDSDIAYKINIITNIDTLYLIITGLMIVSLADIDASQAYGINNLLIELSTKGTLNAKSEYFPFLTNRPKLYRGVDLAKTYGSMAFEFASFIISQVPNEYNEIIKVRETTYGEDMDITP